jgi:hypothetical protein
VLGVTVALSLLWPAPGHDRIPTPPAPPAHPPSRMRNAT